MEEVKSIKDYANSRSVSYENVRRQVKTFADVLDGHIIQQGNTRFLDGFAMEFLDGRRLPKTISIVEESKEESAKDKQIEELREIISRQKDEIIRLHNKLEQKNDELNEANKKMLALMEKQSAADPVQKEESEGEAVADPVEQEPHEEESPGTIEAVESVPDISEESIEEHLEESEGVPDEMKAILDSFLAGEISAKEAWELSGLDKKTFSEMYIQYKRELNEDVTIEADEEQAAADLTENMRDDIAHERESVSDLEENKGEKSVGEVAAPDDPTKELHKMKLQQFAEEPKRTGLLRRIFSFWKN